MQLNSFNAQLKNILYRHRYFQNSSIHTSAIVCWDDYDNQQYSHRAANAYGRAKRAFGGPWRRWKRRWQQASRDPYNDKDIVTGDYRSGRIGYTFNSQSDQHDVFWPFETEVLVVGGGIVGAATAFWLKHRNPEKDYHVTLVESPETFTTSSTILSAGGIRQQFSIPESVQMSLFTAEFLRNAGEWLRVKNNDRPNINLMPMPYLFLANSQDLAEKMEQNWKMQCEQGAKVAMMTRTDLEKRFPFMKFDDILCGTIGLENEGVIDGWQILQAFREKIQELGVLVIKGTVDSFMFEEVDCIREDIPDFMNPRDDPTTKFNALQRIRGAYIRPDKTDVSPRPIRFHKCVNATGGWAGELARKAGIGLGDGLLRIPLPVERRKRSVFVVHCPDGPGLNMPFLIDPSGVWCRREGFGQTYICGRSPTKSEDEATDHSTLEPDYAWFEEKVWPVLAARAPCFENLKMKNAWAGWYDYNHFDENAIIGAHPAYENFIHICGFSGHGLQHAIAAARGFTEHHFDLTYTTINLRKFNYTRILKKMPLNEDGIV